MWELIKFFKNEYGIHTFTIFLPPLIILIIAALGGYLLYNNMFNDNTCQNSICPKGMKPVTFNKECMCVMKPLNSGE